MLPQFYLKTKLLPPRLGRRVLARPRLLDRMRSFLDRPATIVSANAGCGKTTLLNLIGGLDAPTEGVVEVDGFNVGSLTGSRLSRWRSENIGFVFQLYNLLPKLTAEKNVELPLLLLPMTASERRKQVENALDLVGLSNRSTHRPGQLSGGQQQRVGIARAIVTDPTLIVADEPTGDLDSKSADEILRLMTVLCEQLNKTIIMVTHDPKAADRAQRTLHLEKGQLVLDTREKYAAVFSN